MKVARTIAYATVGPTIVLVHSQSKPLDAEWNEYVDTAIAGQRTSSLLVFTYGGGPSAAQIRYAMKTVEIQSGECPPAAILCEGLWMRGLITAFRWLGAQARAFSYAELNEALDYLAVSPASRTEIEETLSRLRQSLQSG